MRSLLVHEYLQASGHQCAQCGYLTVTDIARCPFCASEEIVAVSDVVNRAIQQALKAGAEINVSRLLRPLVSSSSKRGRGTSCAAVTGRCSLVTNRNDAACGVDRLVITPWVDPIE